MIVTAHACDQWRTRIDPRCSGHAEARRAITSLLRDARHDRDLGDVQQYRARSRRWPGRVRIRLGLDAEGRAAVLTVLPEHDGWRPIP